MKLPDYSEIKAKAGRVRRLIDRSLIEHGFGFGAGLGVVAGQYYPRQPEATTLAPMIVGGMLGGLFLGCATVAAIFLYETVAAREPRKPPGQSDAVITDVKDV